MKLRVPFHFSSNPRRTLMFSSIMHAVPTYEKLRPPHPPNFNEGKLQNCCCCFFFLGGGILIRHFILSFPSYRHPYGSAYSIQISPCHGRNDSESFFLLSVVIRHCTHFLSCIVRLLCYVKDVGILISEGAEYRKILNLTVL